MLPPKIVTYCGRRFRIKDTTSREKFKIGWSVVRVVGEAIAGLFLGGGLPMLDPAGEPLRDPRTGAVIIITWDDVKNVQIARESLVKHAMRALWACTPEQAIETLERVLLGNVECELVPGASDDQDAGWVVVAMPEQIDAWLPDPFAAAALVFDLASYLVGPISADDDTAAGSSPAVTG